MNVKCYENEYLGTHTGIEKTLCDTLVTSYKRGYYNIQIFMGSAYSVERRKVSDTDIQKCNELLSKYPIGIYTHLPYIYNLAASVKHNTYLWEGHDEIDEYAIKCLRSIEYELCILSQLHTDCKGCVLHIGSVGKLDVRKGLDKVIESINKIQFPRDSYLLLETMVGRGGVLGTDYEQLRYIYDRVNVHNQPHIGFCIDTCHVFAEGLYHLQTVENIDLLFSDFDKTIGLDKLKLVHFNDSKVRCGEKKDLHMNINKGCIWNSVTSKYFCEVLKKYKIPSVLETTVEDYAVIQEL